MYALGSVVGTSLSVLAERVRKEVSIFSILSDYYNEEIPSDVPMKIACPIQWQHDNPNDRQTRTYPETNSMCCFEIHGYLDSIILAQYKTEESWSRTVLLLSKKYDLIKELSWKERWAMLETAKPEFSPPVLVASLMVWVKRQPGYLSVAFSEDFFEKVSGCVAELSAGVDSSEWLERSKQKLWSYIEEEVL